MKWWFFIFEYENIQIWEFEERSKMEGERQLQYCLKFVCHLNYDIVKMTVKYLPFYNRVKDFLFEFYDLRLFKTFFTFYTFCIWVFCSYKIINTLYYQLGNNDNFRVHTGRNLMNLKILQLYIISFKILKSKKYTNNTNF